VSDTVKIPDITLSPRDADKHFVPPWVEGLRFDSVYGETSVATVWSATQISLDRPVTVWMVRDDGAIDETKAARFESVARAAARIRHPNLAQVIDVSRTAAGIPFMVLENVEGESLAAILRREGRLEKDRALRILLELSSALDTAWKQTGFIHRNIKPETILLADNRTVKLTNFGSATFVRSGENPLAFDGDMMVGTPNYASPEQIECSRHIDFRSDIYSAGALLYHMIAGTAPFADERDPMRVLTLQIKGTLPNPSDMEPPADLSVSRLMQKMMAKSPEDRYGFWQDVIEDIRRILSNRPLFSETSGGYEAPASTVANPVKPAATAGKPLVRRPVGYIVTKTSGTETAATPALRPRKRKPGPFAVIVGSLFIVASMYTAAYLHFKHAANAETAVLTTTDENTAPDPLHEDDAGETPEYATADPQDTPHNQYTTSSSGTTENGYDNAADPHAAATLRETAFAENFTALISDVFAELRDTSKPFDKADAGSKAAIRELFINSTNRISAADVKTCWKIWVGIRDAAPFTELVGRALADSAVTRKIRRDGETITIKPIGYSDSLLVTVYNPDGTAGETRRFDLSTMTRAEMYEIVSDYNVDPSRRALALSKTLLTMLQGTRRDVARLVELHSIPEFLVFDEHVGRQR